MSRLPAVVAAFALIGANAAAGKTYEIVGRGVGWDPKTLTVSRGDVVVWKNVDVVPHNVRQDRGAFASKDLSPGRSFRWTARKRGTLPYKCTLHPEMTGTLIVK